MPGLKLGNHKGQGDRDPSPTPPLRGVTAMALDIDPCSVRMVFLRIGWMDRYQGISCGDAISGGGAYVAEHGYGHEIFNFKPFQGNVYGYVQPPGAGPNAPGQTKINIDRIGAGADDDATSD